MSQGEKHLFDISGDGPLRVQARQWNQTVAPALAGGVSSVVGGRVSILGNRCTVLNLKRGRGAGGEKCVFKGMVSGNDILISDEGIVGATSGAAGYTGKIEDGAGVLIGEPGFVYPQNDYTHTGVYICVTVIATCGVVQDSQGNDLANLTGGEVSKATLLSVDMSGAMPVNVHPTCGAPSGGVSNPSGNGEYYMGPIVEVVNGELRQNLCHSIVVRFCPPDEMIWQILG